jgi:mRNA interferase RelE/StbE
VTPFRLDFPPETAKFIRRLAPDIKHSVKQALRALGSNPEAGDPLTRELEGFWKYRVRRFRIIYQVDRSMRIIRVYAIGERRSIYERVAEQLRSERAREK